MVDIFSEAGEPIADIALSTKQSATLEATGEVALMFHTPQLLRGTLGERSGSFMLRKQGERIVTGDPDAVRRYVQLQRAIRAARSFDKGSGGA